jgi:tetratricopeptide (TPR) repeat protein
MFAPPSDVVAATTNPVQPAVTHVVIQPLDADAYALRAESRLHGPYEKNIEDLRAALDLNPDLAHAHWLLAEIYLATGQAERAKAAADDACDLDPDNAAYQLRRAQACRALGRYDDATFAVRAVLDRDSTPPIVKAQALHEMAMLASLGNADIATKAIAFNNKAIALADSLATSKNIKERRAAKQILVEGHLAVARHIASNEFNNKLESVSQWIGRASGLAEDYIANDGGSVELRLLVAKESLASLASFKPSKDPGPWVSEAEQAAAALSQQCDDDLWRRHVQWELGQVYFQAVRIEHLRLQPAAALRYGQLAIELRLGTASGRIVLSHRRGTRGTKTGPQNGCPMV